MFSENISVNFSCYLETLVPLVLWLVMIEEVNWMSWYAPYRGVNRKNQLVVEAGSMTCEVFLVKSIRRIIMVINNSISKFN